MFKWDRGRERHLWAFYGRWILSPIVGFRHRWESAVFYLTIFWSAIGKSVIHWLDLPFTQDDLLWQMPLAVVSVVGLYRFILFPANQSRSMPAVDETMALYFAADWAKLPARSLGVEAVFELMPGDPSGIGSAGTLYLPGSDHALKWPKHDAVKCKLTNHGDLPLVAVRLSFRVTMQKPVMREVPETGKTNRTEGEIIVSGEWVVTLDKIDCGIAHTQTFYVYNARDMFMRISMPSIASAERLNDRTRRSVSLSCQGAELLLFPVVADE